MRSTIPAIIFSLAFLHLDVVIGQQQPPPAATAPAEQQPPVTFKVEVNYVEIDAVVTDATGTFVRGLTKDDFEVVEQSKPQTISIFSLVDIPVEPSDPPLYAKAPIDPDVRSNNREFDGRVFILVLDDYHTNFQRTPRLRAAARQFVERYLGANDLAAIVTTSGVKGGAQNFTTSRALLLKAIDSFSGRKLRSATLEKLDQLQMPRPDGSAPGYPSELERAHWARSSLGTLKGVAEYMAGIRGRRKAVVFFSEGIDYDITNPVSNRLTTDVLDEMKNAINGATRSNVSYYAVDPRGLAGFEDAIEIQSLPLDNSIGVNTMMDEVRTSQDTLRSLAEETGGFAAVNSNDYRDTFRRIIADNSSYYVIGYYSNDNRRDGRFRNVDVRVKRPGLQVRARKGYLPPRGRPAAKPSAASNGTSPELREALNSPLPVSGLGLTASASVFRGPADKASVLVTVEVDGSGFKFAEKGDRVVTDIELSTIALDAGGTGRDGGRDTATLTLRPQTRDAVMKTGVRLSRRMALAPGIYHIRVGARESGSGSVGMVMLDLDVPDFAKQDLAMSSLMVTSPRAMTVPTPRPDEQFKDVMPAPPTTTREFGRAEELATFTEVYDNQTRTPHRVEIKTSVVADDGTVAFSTTEERRSEEIGTGGGGYGHTAKVPLKALAPGRYVLRVEARSTLGKGATAMREVEFRIR
jgi:VWFA-related protein